MTYEDQLPQDMTDEEYAEWFAQSRVVYGVRMGPDLCEFCDRVLPPDAEYAICDTCRPIMTNSPPRDGGERKAMNECKCDMRTKVVGDGCEVCNPAQAYEYAKEAINDLKRELADLRARLAAILNEWRAEADVRQDEVGAAIADCAETVSALLDERSEYVCIMPDCCELAIDSWGLCPGHARWRRLHAEGAE